MSRSDYYDDDYSDEERSTRCKYCRGTGNDGEGSNYYPCPDCRGRGYVTPESEQEDGLDNKDVSESAV